MGNPWDRAPLAMAGEPDANTLYVAVGEALSEWENSELYLLRIYGLFLGVVPVSARASTAYVEAKMFSKRIKVIEDEAERFFHRIHDQGLEGLFSGLSKDMQRFARRRNDIAHGVVSLIWDKDDLGPRNIDDALGRGEYMLVPAVYRHKDYEPDGSPKYRYTSSEINTYKSRFRELRDRLVTLHVQILKRRAS
ncbi:MAG: hypothetical protein AB7E79_13200 [Rhodospirillaceae bacterium]